MARQTVPARAQVTRCKFCDNYVSWLDTKFGRRMVFDADPIPMDELGERQGWAPGVWTLNGRNRTVLAPIPHYSTQTRQAMRRALVLHSCDEYRQRKAERQT